MNRQSANGIAPDQVDKAELLTQFCSGSNFSIYTKFHSKSVWIILHLWLHDDNDSAIMTIDIQHNLIWYAVR